MGRRRGKGSSPDDRGFAECGGGAGVSWGGDYARGGGDRGAPLHAPGGVSTITAMLSCSRIVTRLAWQPVSPTDALHPMREWQEGCEVQG